MKTSCPFLLLAGAVGVAQAQTVPAAKGVKPPTAAMAHRIVATNSSVIGRKFIQRSKPSTMPDGKLRPATLK